MVLRQRLMEQMESRMQVEDEELRDLIDMAILEAAEGAKRAALFEKRAV